MTTAAPPILDFDISKALSSRMGDAPGASKRSALVGASEVGACQRLTVHNRINGSVFSDKSMGFITTGSALENESIQLLRAGLGKDWKITDTGANQKEWCAIGAPLFSHPDGVLTNLGNLIVLDVKRPRDIVVRNTRDDGAKLQWTDQILTQIGTARDNGNAIEWGLLFVQANNDPTLLEAVWVPWDEDRYEYLKLRAEEIIDAVKSGHLPEGEPDRGYCDSCPIKSECPAYNPALRMGQGNANGLPFDVEVEAAEICVKLAALEPQAEPIVDEIKSLKDRLKELLIPGGAFKGQIAGSKVVLSEVNRNSFDSKAFQKDDAATYGKYVKPTATVTLKVTHTTESQ